MIKQIHVNECNSTQDLLKEQLSTANSSECILVSCENQTFGRGRGENKWQALPGTLCFSINIKPHLVMSFTAIELAVLVARFFEQRGQTLKLKWPNDLWDSENKKCGGILVQGSHNQLYAGIGINIHSDNENFGGVYKDVQKYTKKDLALEVAGFIISNRYEKTNDLKRDWLKRCGHLNHMVTITENEERSEGIFQGLGEYGEAEVCINGQINRFFNGSLRTNN